MPSWELQRNWEIVRYLVYYLIEDLVPPELIPGRDVVDFSAGLGDLSAYMAALEPRSLIATAPDDSPPAAAIADNSAIDYRPNVPAQEISQRLAAASADLFVARMVFQFPTQEQHQIDVDGMLAQVFDLLRPGGRLIIASHQYTELDLHMESAWPEPLEAYYRKLLESHTGEHRQYLAGLIELIETIGLPPREGSHGQTGFGLKASMAMDSFVRAGFRIERAAELEDFTFPVGISRQLGQRKDYYAGLAEKVFAIKQEHILQPDFADKYKRPQILRSILQAIKALHPFVTVPIFAIQARKPD